MKKKFVLYLIPVENPMTVEPGGLHSPWGHKESDMMEAHMQ